MARHFRVIKVKAVKVNRYHDRGAWVTSERTISWNATLEDVLAIAARQGADADEVTDELDTMGITAFKGYMIQEI